MKNTRHDRKSIRLKGYDYSQAGLYFITICVKDRGCLFGNISNGEMQLNNAGVMVQKWYIELQNKFHDIKCRDFIVMPNHFHCIIENVGSVGADLCVCPNNTLNDINDKLSNNNITGGHNSNITGGHNSNIMGGHNSNITGGHNSNITGGHNSNIMGEHIGSPLHRVVQWFKTMSTNEYIRGVKQNNWESFNGKLWQRNYWEHIIRNEKSYIKISEYIQNNPRNWDTDTLNKNI